MSSFDRRISTDKLISLKTNFEERAYRMGFNDYAAYVSKDINNYLPFSFYWLGVANIENETKVKLLHGVSDGYDQRTYERMVNSAENKFEFSRPTINYISNNMNKVVNREDYWTYDEFKESQFFKQHSDQFGQRHFIAVAKRLGYSNKLLFFTLYSSEPSRNFSAEEMAFFEDVSLPLLDIFNSKLGLYSAPPQNEHTDEGLGSIPTEESVSTLKKLQLQIIYTMANTPSYPPTAEETGKNLKKLKKTIENNLTEIYVKFNIVNGVRWCHGDKKFKLWRLSKLLVKSYPGLFR